MNKTTTDIEKAIAHLEDSPRVLLMGQRFFGVSWEENSLTKGIAGERDFMEECLDSVENQKRLDSAGKALPFEESLDSFKQFPWRCVFTSAIDPTAYRLFNRGNRPVQSIFDDRKPHTNNLSLYRLFGATGRDVLAELPPQSKKELRNRRADLSSVLAEIPRAVGPNGKLYVVGWHPGHGDWLRPRDLASILYQLTAEQILIFGLDAEDRQSLEDDDDFVQILEEEKALLFDAPFPKVLDEAAIRGISFVDRSVEQTDTISIGIRSKTPHVKGVNDFDKFTDGKHEGVRLTFSRQEYNRLTESLEIPYEEISSQVPTGTDEEIARRFLGFLGKNPLTNIQDCKHFAFERPVFRDVVLKKVYSLLDTSAPQEKTLILKGQTGSGKSSLIGLLASHLRQSGIPVILMGNRLLPPNRRHIQSLLNAVDQQSSVASVILWDGLERPEEYHNLSDYVASLGKKALVVGTCYETIETSQAKGKSKAIQSITVPIDVSDDERNDLISHFKKFLPSQAYLLEKYNFRQFNNFFALIYFVTGASRLRLSQGVVDEYNTQIQAFDDFVQKQAEPKSLSGMEAALKQALGEKYESYVSKAGENTSEDGKLSDALKLVRVVMVANSFELEMPQALALSVCGAGIQNKFDVYRDAFDKFPVIDAYERNPTEIFVRARLQLEATIWCEKLLPSMDERHKVALEIAGLLDANEAAKQKSSELEFVIRLLQAMGPQGPRNVSLSRSYKKIADCISELAGRCDKLNPRLLHLEANCLREHVRWEQKLVAQENQNDFYSKNTPDEKLVEWQKCLERAIRVLESAEADLVAQLERFSGKGTRVLLATVNTEKAATYGVQLGCLTVALKKGGSGSQFKLLQPMLEKARNSWQRSVAINEESPYTIDVACWIIANALENLPLDENTQYQLKAELAELLERYSELELTADQESRFNRRDGAFSLKDEDEERLVAALVRSVGAGDYSVHALVARKRLDSQNVDAAIEYLRSSCGDVIYEERPVLLLYYRLWWRKNVGDFGYFGEDELTLGLDIDKWKELKALSESRLNLDGESDSRIALFHLAWSSLQLGDPVKAHEVFRHLETVSTGSFRRGRSLAIVSKENGDPREFSGEVRPNIYPHVGRVWVEDVRMELQYKVFEFGDPLEPGEPLGPFHIAMNYRGAFAQPVGRYSGSGKK